MLITIFLLSVLVFIVAFNLTRHIIRENLEAIDQAKTRSYDNGI
jgi:hypothetical protein